MASHSSGAACGLGPSSTASGSSSSSSSSSPHCPHCPRSLPPTHHQRQKRSRTAQRPDGGEGGGREEWGERDGGREEGGREGGGREDGERVRRERWRWKSRDGRRGGGVEANKTLSFINPSPPPHSPQQLEVQSSLHTPTATYVASTHTHYNTQGGAAFGL